MIERPHLEDGRQLLDAVGDLGAVETEQSSLGCENLPPGHVLVETRLLERNADREPDIVGLGHHVESAHPGSPPGGFEQGGEHPDHRGFPGAVGAEKAIDLAGSDVEIDAVDRREVAEGAAKTFGFHGCSMGGAHGGQPSGEGKQGVRESSRRLAG